MTAPNLDYYSLKGGQWVEPPDTSYDIGSRATSIAQISMSLKLRLKAIYPANEVPKELAH